MDPNSAHQLWSTWTFSVFESGRHVQRKDVEYNAAKWLSKGFGSAGQMKVAQTVFGWRIECLIEGPPAHDPAYVENVRREFHERFIRRGWGPLAFGVVEVKLMAGSPEDGRPAAQLVMMPTINLWEP